jgi:thiamine-monophosphate kinase
MLAVNLSDVAAMGGTPRFFVCALGIPPETPVERIERLYEGALRLAERHDVALVGGDTNRSDRSLVLSVTVLATPPRRGALVRSSAKPGDAVMVTGTLGDSALGLKILEEARTSAAHATAYDQLVRRHLEPTPRLDAGRSLADHGFAHAAIDVSDGLAIDATHLAVESAVAIEIDPARIPLSREFEFAAAELLDDPVGFAAAGGEDYELLFTVPERHVADAEEELRNRGVRATAIGRVLEGAGEVRIGDRAASALRTFDHFRAPPDDAALT